MNCIFPRPPRRFALAGVVLSALVGCAGEIDPSLIPGRGGGGSPLGQAGSGGGGGIAAVCDAPQMVFATSCAVPGCHAASSIGGAGLDLVSAGVAARLLGQGPSTNVAAGAACANAGQPYLVAGSNPAAGLLMDKMGTVTVTCGSSMSTFGQLSSSQLACLSAWATAVTTGGITQ
jgi:hypothetical protein